MSFKKPFSRASCSNLSGSAQKKFKKQLLSDFPLLSEDDVESIIPKKSSITVDKLSNKRIVYYVDKGTPLFFDNTNGKGELFPSVYCLWLLPHILPKLIVPWQVSKFIVGGADAMLPGIIGGLAGTFQVGAKRSICCLGNDAPICVGVMDVSSSQVDPSARNKGKGLVVVHHYGDTLWESGNRVNPNEGFLRDRVVAVQSAAQIPQQVKDLVGANVTFLDQEMVEGDEKEAENSVNIHTGVADLSLSSSAPFSDSSSTLSSDSSSAPSSHNIISGTESSLVAEDEGDEAEESVGEGVEEGPMESVKVNAEVESMKEAQSEIPAVEMDEAIETAFYFTLSSRIGVEELPLDCSTLVSLHLPVCNLAHFRLDFKRSSFRQLSKFIHEMGKRGVIREKNTRGVLSIISINSDHPTLTSFRVTKEMTVKAKKNAASLALRSSVPPSGEMSSNVSNRKLQVAYMYSPSNKLRSMFSSGGPLYTLAEATQLLWNYCTKEGIDEGKEVKLDPILAGLFKPPVPNYASKSVLATRFKACLDIHYAIVGGEEETRFRPGTEPKITIVSVMAGRKGKKLTQIVGLEAYGVSPDDFARIAPKKFASSCTTAPIEGKKSIGKLMVVLQGNFVNEVTQYLHSEFGIPLGSIKLEAKTETKK